MHSGPVFYVGYFLLTLRVLMAGVVVVVEGVLQKCANLKYRNCSLLPSPGFGSPRSSCVNLAMSLGYLGLS